MVSTQQAILLVFTFVAITVTMARSTKLRSTYLDVDNSPPRAMATYARTDNNLNTWWNFGNLFPFDLFSRPKKTSITTTTTRIPFLTTSVKVSTKIRTTRSTTDTQVPLRPMSSEYFLWRVTSSTKLPTSEAPTLHDSSVIVNRKIPEATTMNQVSRTESDRLSIVSDDTLTSADEASITTSTETTTTSTSKIPTTTASTTKIPTTTASTTKMPTTTASTTKMPTTTTSTTKMPTTTASTTKMPTTTTSTTKMPTTTTSTTKMPTTTTSTTKMPSSTTAKASWSRRNRGSGRGNHRRSHRHRHFQRHSLHRLQRKIEKSRKRFTKRIRKLQRHFEKERQANHLRELRELEARHHATMKKLMDIINQMVKQYPRRTQAETQMEYANKLSKHVYDMIDTNFNGRVEVNDIKQFLMLHGVFDQSYSSRTSKHLKPR